MRQTQCALIGIVMMVAGILPASGAAAGDNAVQGAHLKFSIEDKSVTVTISGRVTDAQTGQPIAGALVRGHIVIWHYKGPELFDKCPYQETQTDAQGQYALSFVTVLTMSGPMKGKDNACVYVSSPGYETKPEYTRPNISANKTDFPNFDFQLAQGRLVKGTVVDDENHPISGAMVKVQNSLNGDWNYFGSLGQTNTDSNGKFEVWIHQPDSSYVAGTNPWLRISKDRYGMGYFWDLFEKEDQGMLVIPRGSKIQGRIIDTKNAGVPNCEVSVWDMWRCCIDKTTTDVNGNYELSGIPQKQTLANFYQWKNKRMLNEWTALEVYARTNVDLNLNDVPKYEIQTQDSEFLRGPELMIGMESGVSGRLIPAKSGYGLGGLMVRLDGAWDNMVEADAEGKFAFPSVSPGKHRLTAYLPHNLRGDRGIGQVEIDVKEGEAIESVSLQLEELTEVTVRFTDANGSPLEGIIAGAMWTQSGDGFWTEGTLSDKDGWATLYLYPGEKQYVRGFDRSGKLVAEYGEEIQPQAGQAISNVQVIMVAPAGIQGRLIKEDGQPLADAVVSGTLDYADGLKKMTRFKTDAAGQYKIEKLQPGIVKLSFETVPEEYTGTTGAAIEIAPGVVKDFKDITLTRIQFYQVSGRVRPSQTLTNLAGYKIRVDLMQWEPMLPTDEQGRFVLPKVPAGKHRLTAYLPFNLRGNRGVGHTEIEVKDADLNHVEIPLENLAVIHMRITDQAGKPLEGISAAAWWTPDHSGIWTEGTKSDKQGNATLYLYPDDLQYIGAYDWENNRQLKEHKSLNIKANEVIKDLPVIMLP
jgi:protocatechuate 3,4-dioxygenase beta subunit